MAKHDPKKVHPSSATTSPTSDSASTKQTAPVTINVVAGDGFWMPFLKAMQLLKGPRPPGLMTFWVNPESIKRNDLMALICDVTIGWVPSTDTSVTGQAFSATSTDGSNPPVPVSQTLAPTVASQVIVGLHAGSTIQASVAAVGPVASSPALTGSYTVPDLTAPVAPTAMTFTPGNIRDDGVAPAPPAEPPAVPAA